MKYLLDTHTIGYALRGEGDVAGHITAHKPSDLCVSAISLAELRFGADRKGSRRLHNLIDTFAAAVEVVEFGEDAAFELGRIGTEGAGPCLGELEAAPYPPPLPLSPGCWGRLAKPEAGGELRGG
jgi:tRNA(fMet)-specific endonuclease VapC